MGRMSVLPSWGERNHYEGCLDTGNAQSVLQTIAKFVCFVVVCIILVVFAALRDFLSPGIIFSFVSTAGSRITSCLNTIQVQNTKTMVLPYPAKLGAGGGGLNCNMSGACDPCLNWSRVVRCSGKQRSALLSCGAFAKFLQLFRRSKGPRAKHRIIFFVRKKQKR